MLLSMYTKFLFKKKNRNLLKITSIKNKFNQIKFDVFYYVVFKDSVVCLKIKQCLCIYTYVCIYELNYKTKEQLSR